MDIENFIAEFKKTFVYDLLSMTLKDEQLFEHMVDGDAVLWFKEQTRQMWLMWEKAKAQAVPEGFVLVKKELPEQIAEKMAIDRIDKPRHENDPVWREIAEQSYKDQVKSKKWEFWRDYKAMIEAQEPTND